MPETLYAARGGSATTSDLYTINPVTAAPTSIGPIGFAITGLAFDPTSGVLYGVTSNNSAADPHSLITIDPLTGAGTLVGDLGLGSDNASDIAFADDGTLYAWTTISGVLASINISTGAMTLIGATGVFGGGISFASFVLYHIPRLTSDDIGSVDTSTGLETPIVESGASAQVVAASYGNGAMYISEKGVNYLETIDLVTGAATNIGVISAGDPFDGIAWSLLAPPPPPVPPDPRKIRLADPPPWRLFITDIGSQTLTLLDKRATGRQFVFTLNGPAYATGQVAADDPEINIPYPDPDSPAMLTNNARLLYALRREGGTPYPYVCRFGGIVMNLEDQSGDSPTSRYTAYDPWQLLMSRPVRDPDTGLLPGPDGLLFPDGTRASDIAVDLLGATEAVDGETFIDTSVGGLITATDPISGAFSLDRGLSVGEAWQQLVETGTIDIVLIPIYEPITKPGKVVQLKISPQAGAVRHDAVMGWDSPPRSLQNISRLVDGTRLANRVQYYAGQGGSPVALQSDAASIAAYGEYWTQQFFPGTNNAALVELLGLTEVLIRRNGQRNISFDPAPERSALALRDYGLADYLPTWASKNLREPMAVDYDEADPSAAGYQRVYTIPIDLDDNGTERVRGLMTSKDTGP